VSRAAPRRVDEQFFARLSTSRERFAHEVPAMLGRLASARAAFDAAMPDRALAEDLRAQLHTIAGSGATFGFRVLGQQARGLEQRLRVLMAFDAVLEADWKAWFDQLDAFVAWGLRDPKAASYRQAWEQ
jgi:HPt (histidine-containing phosphotransfer) domain-containing protein